MQKLKSTLIGVTLISSSVMGTGMPSNGKGFGGLIQTDDPFSKCPGSNEFVSFNGEGGGVFLNDIATGKVKKTQKGISYKIMKSDSEGTTRELFEVKQPSFPTGYYVFTKDSKGNVIKVELSSSKKDKDIEREAEILLSGALENNSTRVKVPTHRVFEFTHTPEGCQVSRVELTSKVMGIKNGKIDKKDDFSTIEREYDERTCDLFNKAKNENPDLMKKISECSFSGSDLLKNASGLLEKIRKEGAYGDRDGTIWTPNTSFPHDAISNVRLGSRSIDDIVALPMLASPSRILRSMTDLNTLCDEKFSMWHSGNLEVRKIRASREEKGTIKIEDSNSISK